MTMLTDTRNPVGSLQARTLSAPKHDDGPWVIASQHTHEHLEKCMEEALAMTGVTQHFPVLRLLFLCTALRVIQANMLQTFNVQSTLDKLSEDGRNALTLWLGRNDQLPADTGPDNTRLLGVTLQETIAIIKTEIFKAYGIPVTEERRKRVASIPCPPEDATRRLRQIYSSLLEHFLAVVPYAIMLHKELHAIVHNCHPADLVVCMPYASDTWSNVLHIMRKKPFGPLAMSTYGPLMDYLRLQMAKYVERPTTGPPESAVNPSFVYSQYFAVMFINLFDLMQNPSAVAEEQLILWPPQFARPGDVGFGAIHNMDTLNKPLVHVEPDGMRDNPVRLSCISARTMFYNKFAPTLWQWLIRPLHDCGTRHFITASTRVAYVNGNVKDPLTMEATNFQNDWEDFYRKYGWAQTHPALDTSYVPPVEVTARAHPCYQQLMNPPPAIFAQFLHSSAEAVAPSTPKILLTQTTDQLPAQQQQQSASSIATTSLSSDEALVNMAEEIVADDKMQTTIDENNNDMSVDEAPAAAPPPPKEEEEEKSDNVTEAEPAEEAGEEEEEDYVVAKPIIFKTLTPDDLLLDDDGDAVMEEEDEEEEEEVKKKPVNTSMPPPAPKPIASSSAAAAAAPKKKPAPVPATSSRKSALAPNFPSAISKSFLKKPSATITKAAASSSINGKKRKESPNAQKQMLAKRIKK
jgi:hypothetical protein